MRQNGRVCIDGIKMPTRCGKCIFRGHEKTGGHGVSIEYSYCLFDAVPEDEYLWNNDWLRKKPKNCPLKECVSDCK